MHLHHNHFGWSSIHPALPSLTFRYIYIYIFPILFLVSYYYFIFIFIYFYKKTNGLHSNQINIIKLNRITGNKQCNNVASLKPFTLLHFYNFYFIIKINPIYVTKLKKLTEYQSNQIILNRTLII